MFVICIYLLILRQTEIWKKRENEKNIAHKNAVKEPSKSNNSEVNLNGFFKREESGQLNKLYYTSMST
jgi:hypothetical protein